MATEEKDIYLKDEGGFMTVCFVSNEAKKALKDSNNSNGTFNPTGVSMPKMDIAYESLSQIIIWAITWNLSIDRSDLDIF